MWVCGCVPPYGAGTPWWVWGCVCPYGAVWAPMGWCASLWGQDPLLGVWLYDPLWGCVCAPLMGLCVPLYGTLWWVWGCVPPYGVMCAPL